MHAPYTSTQLVELYVVAAVFKTFFDKLFNLYTDSAYMAYSVPLLETVAFIKPSTEAVSLFLQIQEAIRSRSHPFFIGHLRPHTGLPGPLSEGNTITDLATHTVCPAFESAILKAQHAHSLCHLNAHTLRLLFKVTREQARQIVKQYPSCITFLPTPHLGVNPRGLIPNNVWQMDVTHIPEFGNLKYLYVSVDTFSGFIYGTLQMGEAGKHVIAHTLACLSILGKHKIIKIDNGPGYVGKNFQSFCSQFQSKHITGFPYNPQGQGIVEQAHQTLKHTFEKLKRGEIYPVKGSPRNILTHSLFILNFLNLDAKGRSAADRLWYPNTKDNYANVLWKDPLTYKCSSLDPVLI